MCALNRAMMLTLSLSIVVLISVGCSKEANKVNAISSGYAASSAVSSVPALVALPSFTALVKHEGSKVICTG